jgi:hypothetical protein
LAPEAVSRIDLWAVKDDLVAWVHVGDAFSS